MSGEGMTHADPERPGWLKSTLMNTGHGHGCAWHLSRSAEDCSCSAAALRTGENAPISDGDNYANGQVGRAGNWMQTFRGGQFWPIDPRADEVFIEDIAHGLANLCRFTGHCNSFYSVAEHSVIVSHLVPTEHALTGLMHDATEAYVGDIGRPLKLYLAGYKEIELRIWRAIADRYGLPHELPACIKLADNAALLAEGDKIMKPHPAPWCVPGEPASVKIACWQPAYAEWRFMERFRELTLLRASA